MDVAEDEQVILSQSKTERGRISIPMGHHDIPVVPCGFLDDRRQRTPCFREVIT